VYREGTTCIDTYSKSGLRCVRGLYFLLLVAEYSRLCGVINLNKQDGETKRVAIFIRFKFICEFKAIQIYLSMRYFMSIKYYWF